MKSQIQGYNHGFESTGTKMEIGEIYRDHCCNLLNSLRVELTILVAIYIYIYTLMEDTNPSFGPLFFIYERRSDSAHLKDIKKNQIAYRTNHSKP